MGLKKYGKGDWRNISRNFVTTRTPTQVASHAQKYFIRQLTGGKDKRRSSIHDITTTNLPDNSTTQLNPNKIPSRASYSTDHNLLHQPPPVKTEPQYYNQTSSKSLSNGGMTVGPFCGISSLGPKLLQDQIFVRGNFHGCQNIGSYTTSVFQMQREQHYK